MQTLSDTKSFSVLQRGPLGKLAMRFVHVPLPLPEGQDAILDLIYHYGQNDIQPVERRCSVSVGDIIILRQQQFDLDGEPSDDISSLRFEVADVGFTKVGSETLPKQSNFL